MTDDKKLSMRFFKSKHIEARHFPKRKIGKKADFELYLENRLFGYCELKSIVDYDFSGERPDPTYNKIQNKIHEAAKQLKTVNTGHSVPNIVFFINHTNKVGWQDLWYVLMGQVTPPSQPTEPIDMRYLNRLMDKGDLEVIDYFIWANISGSNISFCINQASPFTADLKRKISSKAYERDQVPGVGGDVAFYVQ